jgi:hypothetical protein
VFAFLALVVCVMICIAPLVWLQLRMVKLVYPKFYISPWNWDHKGFEKMQCRLIESYWKRQNIGKMGRMELKRRLQKRAEKKFSPVVMLVFGGLFAGLWSAWYQVKSA